MTPYSDFFVEILPEVVGCPEPFIIHALKQATIDFCRRSKWLRVDMDSFAIQAGEGFYDLDPPEGYSVENIVRATFIPDGRLLTPLSIADADEFLPGWELNASTRPEHYVLYSEEQQVRLIHTPSETILDAIALRVALRPSQDSIGVPEVLFDEWMSQIAAGAKARLMMMPAKQWTNPPTAMLYATIFKEAIRRARQRAERDNTRGPRTARAIPFGGFFGMI